MFSTLGISGSYGLFGSDWVRFHAKRVTGGIVLQHAATGGILPGLPTRYINSGLMVRLMSDLGEKVNMSAVPDRLVKKAQPHPWKVELDLDGICAKFGVSDADKTLLVATYFDVTDKIAA